MTESWTRKLATFIVEADTATAPAEVRELALRPIADTIGCMAAGLASDLAAVVGGYVQAPADLTLDGLWGQGARLPVESAALVGGSLGAALDYDDVSATGHPSSILMAAALSADVDELPGAMLLDAYLVGYEVMTRVGQAMMLPHTRYGWHATSTTGYFGAVAVAARLYRLDVEQTAHAIGAAASMAAGIARNFGTMTKPVHSGLAARGGLTAAGLARAGLTAGSDVLDGARNFLDMYGLGASTPEMLDRLGAPWAMAERAPSLKRFPSCYATHRPIDAMLEIQREHGFSVDEVEQIVLRAPIRATGGLAYPTPVTGFEAKFSGTYPVAAAFLDGDVTIASFADDRVLRDDAVRLIAKMDLAEDPRCLPDDPEGINASPIEGGFWEITVRATGGREVVATASEPPGAPSRQLGWEELRAKFVDCASSSGHASAAADGVFASLRELSGVTDVRLLLADLGERGGIDG